MWHEGYRKSASPSCRQLILQQASQRKNAALCGQIFHLKTINSSLGFVATAADFILSSSQKEISASRRTESWASTWYRPWARPENPSLIFTARGERFQKIFSVSLAERFKTLWKLHPRAPPSPRIPPQTPERCCTFSPYLESDLKTVVRKVDSNKYCTGLTHTQVWRYILRGTFYCRKIN